MAGFGKKADVTPNWHPDFRLPERLPDIKIIRTRFLIHFVSVGLFAILLAVVLYREMITAATRTDVQDYQDQRDTKAATNKDLLDRSARFRALANEVDDLMRFNKQPFWATELLVKISKIRSDQIVFDKLVYDQVWNADRKKVVYRIRIDGKGKTTDDIKDIKVKFEKLELPKSYKVEVSETGNPSKDVRLGFFSFSMILSVFEV